MKASKFPRGCRPKPAQLAGLRNGTTTWGHCASPLRLDAEIVESARAADAMCRPPAGRQIRGQLRRPAQLAGLRERNDDLGPAQPRPAPTDAEIVEALNAAADALLQASGGETNPGATAYAARLATLLKQLTATDPWVRAKASSVFAAPLRYDLDQIRLMLNPQHASPCQLFRPRSPATGSPPDGKASSSKVLPKGDSNNDTAVLRAISRPRCLRSNRPRPELPVMFQEAARIIVHAFIEATALALVSIAIILLIALRRIGDVLLTLVPLDRRARAW